MSIDQYSPPDAMQPRNALLSISMDIAGSTAAKQQIRTFQRAHGTSEQQLKAYLSHLVAVERDFYEGIQHAGIPLAKLFVMKHLGDEIWIVLDVMVDDACNELRSITHKVLRAMYGTMTRSGMFEFVVGTPNVDEEDWQSSDRHSWLPIHLGLKATVDLIQDATELSAFRFDALTQLVMRETDFNATAEDRNRLWNRLHLGHGTLDGTKHRIAYRSDYVGFDVDRFFRLAGTAVPGLVLVGDALSSALNAQYDHTVAPDCTGRWSFEYPLNGPVGSHSRSQWRGIRKDFASGTFKGITEDYAGHYLFDDSGTVLPMSLPMYLNSAAADPSLDPLVYEKRARWMAVYEPTMRLLQDQGTTGADQPLSGDLSRTTI